METFAVFFLKILRWDDVEMEFEEGDMECLIEKNGEDNEQSQKIRGKNWKNKIKLKTAFEMQNTCFSRLIQVARVTHQNT